VQTHLKVKVIASSKACGTASTEHLSFLDDISNLNFDK
jgi:hypothetical protein